MFGAAVFDNREFAILLWIGAATLLLLARGDSRKSIRGVIQTAASPKLAIPLGIMTMYLGAVVVALWMLGMWTTDLFSETLFWFVGTALVLFVSLDVANRDPRFFRHAVLRVLSFTVFVQFVVNLFTMSLFVELLLVPTSLLLGGMLVLSQLRPEFKSIHGCINLAVVTLGVALLLYSVAHAMQDPGSAFTAANGREVLVPIVLTLSLVPLLYFVALYINYDSVLLRLRMILDEHEAVYRGARRRLLLCVGLRLRTIIRAARAPWWIMLSRPANHDEVDAVIAHIKSRRSYALAPPAGMTDELARIGDERSPGWEYVLLAARLDAGARALAFLHPAPDEQGRAFSRTPTEQRLIELIQSDNRDAVALVKDLETVFDRDRVERAFGRSGEPGDADRIIELAEALILGYDRMLAWTDHSRATRAPDRLATLAEMHSHLMDQPNKQIEEYIDRWNDVATRMSELVDQGAAIGRPSYTRHVAPPHDRPGATRSIHRRG